MSDQTISSRSPRREAGREVTLQDAQTLIKHSATVHMTNVLSPVERRAYNSLLYLARPSMQRGADHIIDTSRLMVMVGCTANNRDHLIGTVIGLVGRTVTYNVFGKDTRDEEVWRMTSVLLADAGFTADKSQLRYSFPNSIVDLLKHPSLYARINLAVQRKMRRAGAMALYEFYLDTLGGRRRDTEFTMDLSALRLLLGATAKFEQFKELRRYVIDPAHEEINAVSDLRVSVVQMVRKGRAVSALAIRVERTGEGSGACDQGDAPSEPVIVAPAAGGSGAGGLEARLTDALGVGAANQVMGRYDAERVRANLDYALAMYDRGGIRNLRAYFLRAITEDYAGSAPRTPKRPAGRKSPAASTEPPPVDPRRAAEDLRIQETRAWYGSLSAAEQARCREEFEGSELFRRMASLLRGRQEESQVYVSALLLFLAERAPNRYELSCPSGGQLRMS